MVGISMSEDVLNQVIAVLIASNYRQFQHHWSTSELSRRPTINQGDARTIRTSFTDTFEIALQEIRTTDLEAFFDDFGSELVHAILRGIAEDVIDSAATVLGNSMLANMLDAPIAELSVCNDVYASEHFVDARTLICIISSTVSKNNAKLNHTLSSSRQFSKMF